MRRVIVGLLLALVSGCGGISVQNRADDSFSPVIVSCFGSNVKVSVEPRERDGGTIKIECPGNATAATKLSVASAEIYVARNNLVEKGIDLSATSYIGRTKEEDFVSRLIGATIHGSSIGRTYDDVINIDFTENVNDIGFVRIGMLFGTGDRRDERVVVILKNRQLNRKSPVFFYDRQVPRF
ncbi:MAG: hypothetical protein IKC27_09765 [Kiritimatiellae bacterium]|nr:hypothetical protein [Kiritimatiellia bacterium]